MAALSEAGFLAGKGGWSGTPATVEVRGMFPSRNKQATQQKQQQQEQTQKVTQMETETKQANKARENEIRQILDEIIGMYRPGGAFGQGTEAMLERSKTKDIASAQQSLVSSGLFNTTQTAGLGKKWEEEVGMPTRAKLEDVRYGQLGSALGQKAGFVERIENQYPAYDMLAQMLMKTYGSS